MIWCWHRPGRLIRVRKEDYGGKVYRIEVRVCRHCGVAIEECPHEPRKRHEEPCPCCGGSFWVAIVRGWRAKFAQYVNAQK